MIYLVEDDASIRELVVYTLNGTGMEAEGFDRPSKFWEALERRMPDLVLMDIMLPEEDGLHILQKLRASPQTGRLPVMLISAKGSEYDKVVGLDSGADDYMAKPFGMMELISRIKALMRRSAPSETHTGEYRVGSLCVWPDRHMVTVEGQTVSLTLKEFQMLCLLLENRDIVMTRDQLLNLVWGYAFDGESRTVDVHIRTLRQKLGVAGEYIETVRGIGYKIGKGHA